MMKPALFLPLLFVVATSAASVAGEGWRGVFEPRAEAVIPAETAMTVKSMPKKAGDRCEKGDLLVEFDSSLAYAAVAATRTKLAAEEKNFAGIKSLYERSQASVMELARAESDLAEARLDVAVALREAEACRVRAPFAGKIVEEKLREFEWASKGAPLLLLVDDSVLRVRFFLPEEQYSTIRIGDSIPISVPAASADVTGVVSRLGAVFDPVSRTFDVWADVDNKNDTLRAGMTADVLWEAGGAR